MMNHLLSHLYVIILPCQRQLSILYQRERDQENLKVQGNRLNERFIDVSFISLPHVHFITPPHKIQLNVLTTK